VHLVYHYGVGIDDDGFEFVIAVWCIFADQQQTGVKSDNYFYFVAYIQSDPYKLFGVNKIEDGALNFFLIFWGKFWVMGRFIEKDFVLLFKREIFDCF
jgi:hypothetical protein